MLGSATSWIQNELFKIHGPLVYVVVAALVFAEVGIVIGFFLPGEIATIIGGVIASEHRANLVLMIVVVVAAAAAGNLSGYELGRIAGPWLVSHRPLRGHAGVAHAERLIARRGGPAVVIGRWIAVVRSVLPGLAGMSDMSRPTFITLSAVGAVGWGTMWVLVGFAVGRTYVKVLNAAGTWSLVALGLLAVAIVAFLVWRKLLERRAHRHGGAGS
jgi:membrane protein DedA with SNARE-associated domain